MIFPGESPIKGGAASENFNNSLYCLTVAIIFWFQSDRKVEANATGKQGRGSQVMTLAVYNFVRIRIQVWTLYVG